VRKDHPRDVFVIQQVLAGEPNSFRELVERYQGAVYSLCYRFVGNPSDAEELTQQAFVEVFTGLGSFDLQRSFVAWLMCITANNCRDHRKSHKRKERPLSGEVEQGAALFQGHLPSPEQSVADGQRRTLLAGALARLDSRYRLPLILKDLEGLSYEEMQEILHLPITTLKIRVVRARQKLQEALACLKT
jgi:RNA polymerase sigma-70 factor, ECF subfamily